MRVLLPLLCLVPVLRAQISDPASYVLPFIGTLNSGHVFPGATLPHGMAKAGLDTDSPDGQAGYDANPIYHATGFSQLHDSGTGGGFSLSNFKLWPLANCSSFSTCPTGITARKVLRNLLSDGSPDDAASPGYFASNLSTLIRVELTATRRTALHRYTFPSTTTRSTEPRILVDITNDAQDSAQGPTVLIDPNTGRITGGASFAPSFGIGRYNAFVCADFRGVGYNLGKPTEYGVYTDNNPVQGTTTTPTASFAEMGALLTFAQNPDGPTAILARVGVSLISTDQACANAESEIPDFDFERVHQDSRAQWNELLGRVQVNPDGVPRDTVELFYSSLYRTHIVPADYTGENPRWTSTEPYYDSYYCNWDTYRTLYSLMSLHDPITFAQITRALIDVQRNEGWLPECRSSTDMQWVQGGSNADPIVAEFFVKFHEQAQALGVSADDLYTALLADAEKQPSSWAFQGRQANVYNQFGYLPWDVVENGFAELNTRHVSRTLEYAFDDFAISQVAKILGKTDDAAKYSGRAANFLNVWNPETSVPDNASIVGMMQPRYQNGSFGFTDPRHCSIHDPTHSTCFLTGDATDGFYEGSPLIYSQYVPQDTAKLIELQGGKDSFIARLDFIFEQGYYEPGDEPSQQMPFQYTYTNSPGLSTRRSRQVITAFYNTSKGGLPGNDDSGAMGSYAAFFLAGLYPVPATRQYLLSSPYFKDISFYNPLYKTTTRIIAKGFSGNPPDGTGNVFVQSVTVNGQPYKSNCYLEWDVFIAGSTVELTLTDDINVSCGSGPDALPPSLSTGGFN